MSKRVPASMRTRPSLSDVIEGRLSSPAGREELVKLATPDHRRDVGGGSARRGRPELYEHGAEPGSGYRNDYRPGRLKTVEGAIDSAAPQVAGKSEPYRSAIREHLKRQTQALEDLAIELLARGLSVRDMKSATRAVGCCCRGPRCRRSAHGCGQTTRSLRAVISPNTTSPISSSMGSPNGCPGQRREPVLAAWGHTSSGAKILLHLMAGSKEDAETVTAFFQDMRARGLGDPLLVVSDGAPGIVKALETCFPRSERQRCLAHRMRNLAAKVPEDRWPEFKVRATAWLSGALACDRP